MARKRKNGEGSWGKKNFKGVPYFYYRDSNGNYTYAKSEKEVKEKLKKKEEQEHLIKSSNKLTLGEYITSWLYNKKFKESLSEKNDLKNKINQLKIENKNIEIKLNERQKTIGFKIKELKP